MKEKILLVANDIDRGKFSETAGSRFIKYIEKNRTNYSSLYLSKKFNNVKNLQDNLKLNKYNYIFFLFDPYIFFDYKFLLKLKKKYYLIVFHADIDEHFEDNYVYSSQLFDLILVDEILEVNRYRLFNYKAEHFEFGFDKQQVNFNDKDIDVSFVGRFDRYNRKELFDFLKRKKIKFEIFGKGTVNGMIDHDKMKAIYNRSKIVLNLTAISESKPYSHKKYHIRSRNKQVKGRPYEAMLSGSLLITEKTHGMSKIFPKNTFINAENNEEFCKKILFYLNNNEQRLVIARSGKKYAEENFTFENTIKKFENYLKLHLKKPQKSKFIIDQNYKSLIFKALINEIIKSNIYNFNWSLYCLKRIKINFSSIFDLTTLIYSYFVNVVKKII